MASPGRLLRTVLRLTAIILLLRPMGPWFTRPGLLFLAVLALILPPVLVAPATWLAASALIAVTIAADWPSPDNHIYLLSYWCLACGLALRERSHSLARLGEASRWLLGAAFALAVVWKGVLSLDYGDGRFFRVTLLSDPRFEDAALLFGGMSRAELEAARAALDPLPMGAERLDGSSVHEAPRLRALAVGLTWGGLALEGLVAAAMVLPTRAAVIAARHAALLTFCGVTYALAPVAGFGWLLAVMGLAMCPPGAKPLQAAYLVLFVLILLYSEVPWSSLILRWMAEPRG